MKDHMVIYRLINFINDHFTVEMNDQCLLSTNIDIYYKKIFVRNIYPC